MKPILWLWDSLFGCSSAELFLLISCSLRDDVIRLSAYNLARQRLQIQIVDSILWVITQYAQYKRYWKNFAEQKFAWQTSAWGRKIVKKLSGLRRAPLSRARILWYSHHASSQIWLTPQPDKHLWSIRAKSFLWLMCICHICWIVVVIFRPSNHSWLGWAGAGF